ncbi:hypothetical protein ACG7TL_005354 [Trametes sanguinea]
MNLAICQPPVDLCHGLDIIADMATDGSAIFHPDASGLLLTAGKSAQEHERNRLEMALESMRFVTGTGMTLVGTGAVGNSPAVEGVEWQEDNDGESERSRTGLSRIGQLLDAMELADGMESIAEAELDESDIDDDEDIMSSSTYKHTSDPASPWYPYPDKLTFLLATLMNKPRTRFSQAQLKGIIWVLRELGHSVPSLKAFSAMQDRIRHLTNLPTICKSTSTGTVFYRNRVPDLIRMASHPQDWANPNTRPYIQEYPIRSKSVSEAYHARKRVQVLSPEVTAPMWADGGKHYYVGELAQLADGHLVIPKCWYRLCVGGDVYADVWQVAYKESVQAYEVYDPETTRICSTDLVANVYDLLDLTSMSSVPFEGRVPASVHISGLNPLREIAKGRRMHTSFIKLWGDDVSGNRSKQYNAHTNIYFTHANLPHKQLSQQYHIKFASTSQHATSGEQFDAVVDDISGDATWHIAYDCAIGEEIVFRVLPEVLPADNPQQSASCSHVGLHGNYPCRRCHFGGTERQRESDEGYEAHFAPGIPRVAATTQGIVLKQLRQAGLGIAKAVSDMQTLSGVKDPLAEYWIQQLIARAREQQQIRIRNPATRDPRLNGRRIVNRAAIVTEIENTIQEELMRWLATQPSWNYEALPTDSEQRLQLRPGVHFSALLQVEGLDVHRDTPVELLHTYLLGVQKATGELGALLWYHEIEDLREYKDDLTVLIGNLLDIWSSIDPQRVFVKLKLHILLHVLEDIEHHGPSIHNSTEGFESYNAVFRESSVLSNHLAPSRDIAQTSAVMESHKHIVSGGWWKNNDGTHVRAGPRVRQYFADDLRFQEQLGRFTREARAGTVHCLQRIKKQGGTPLSSFDLQFANNSPRPNPESLWYPCKSVVSRHGDECRQGSWVFALYQNTTVVGRIVHILKPAIQGSAHLDLVVIKQYTVLNTRHPVFHMPELRHEAGKPQHTVVLARDVLFNVNVQHNCRDSGCTANDRRIVRQERRETNLTTPVIKHVDDDLYLLNTHALHHAALVRKALPRELTKPIPYINDRVDAHKRIAVELRAAHEVRRKRDADARHARKTKANAPQAPSEMRIAEPATTGETPATGVVASGTAMLRTSAIG